MKSLVLALLLFGSISMAMPAGFIQQVNVFLGEVASNLTAGAPISVSSTGKLASGLTTSNLTATSATTTTGTGDGLMASMTTSSLSAGTYLVWFSTWCSHSQGNQTITFSLYNNGSQVADTVRNIIPFVGALSAITQDAVAAFQTQVTVAASTTVQVEWHTSAGTATCTQRALTFLRVL